MRHLLPFSHPFRLFPLLALSFCLSFPAWAASTQPKTTSKAAVTPKKAEDTKSEPVSLGTFESWHAYVVPGKTKTCYALAQPKNRTPVHLKQEKTYLFISSRPSEAVKDEISIILDMDAKTSPDPVANVKNLSVPMTLKGRNLWIKAASDEARVLDALKKGDKLTVKYTSTKGNPVMDEYALKGLSQALQSLRKECP